MPKIIRNSVKCLLCQEEIESKSRHDFVGCSCGNVSVDGGRDYQRILWKRSGDTWTNTAVLED